MARYGIVRRRLIGAGSLVRHWLARGARAVPPSQRRAQAARRIRSNAVKEEDRVRSYGTNIDYQLQVGCLLSHFTVVRSQPHPCQCVSDFAVM